MGIWWRGGRKSAAFFLHGRIRYSIPTPSNLLHRSRLITQDTDIILPLFQPHSDSQFFFPRSYAALVQVKPKEGESKIQAANEHDGPRLNAEITAHEVRLVSEKGHEVIPRREALARAKKLKLDLVEVQRNANPPVCKIMDYNKEKYKQQQREKERTKNKSELTLRKADCREIRFTSKTEQKDLERKAEMVKRLLERGYRVKCTAMGSAQEKLEEQLLRLSTLIEDFSVVESGPRVEKKGAWLIVKHIKFGQGRKNEVQRTPKSVEISKSEVERDNTTTSEREKKKVTVMSPKEAVKGKLGPFEEHAPLEKFKEFSSEEVSTVDRVEGMPNADVLFANEKKDKILSFNEEFKEECVPFEEHAPTEHFKEFATEEVPSIDRIEEIRTANVLFTSEMEMHTTSPVKQDSVVVDSNNYTETEIEVGDSNNKQDSHYQTRKTLSDSHSILHGCNASNREKEFPVDQSPNQSLGLAKAKACEILKQGPSSLPVSTDLNIGPEKQDQLGPYDCKQSVPVDGLKQVIFEKIYSDQGHHASNVGKSQPVDPVSEWAGGSITDRVKDIHDDHQFHVSTTSEVTSNIVKELQTPPMKLNYAVDQSPNQSLGLAKAKAREILKQGPSSLPVSTDLNIGPEKQDQLGPYDCKQSVPVDGLKQVIFEKIHSDQGHHASNVGKSQPVDPVSEWAGGSITDRVKDIHDHQFHVSTTSEVTSNIVKELQTPPMKLNYAAPTQDQQKMAVVTPKISAANLRQILVNRSSGSQERTGKQPLADILPKKANESRWAILKQVKPSRFDGNKNNTPTSEVTSNIIEELKTSPVKLNNDAATQDQQHMVFGNPHIAADGLDGSGQVLVNCSSTNHEIRVSETGKQPLADMIPKQPKETQLETFRERKPSNFQGNDNTATLVQLGVSNGKHQAVSDDTRKDPSCPSPSDHGKENVGKQIPIASASIPAKVAGEIHGIFSQGQSSAVEINEYVLTQTEIGAKNAKQTTPSLRKREDLSAVRSSSPGYSAIKEVSQKPLDSSPKKTSNTEVSSYGISKKSQLTRDSLKVPNSNTIPWNDARKAPAIDSPSDQGSCASVRGKQQSSASGVSHWGIFSQPKSSIVENQRHPAKLTQDQSKKEQPNIVWGPNIGASDEAQNDADPRHLLTQNQRKFPTSSTGTSNWDPKKTENEAVDEPRQKGWGIFSKKVLTKPLDTKGKPGV